MTDERKTLGVLVVSSGTKASDFFKSSIRRFFLHRLAVRRKECLSKRALTL